MPHAPTNNASKVDSLSSYLVPYSQHPLGFITTLSSDNQGWGCCIWSCCIKMRSVIRRKFSCCRLVIVMNKINIKTTFKHAALASANMNTFHHHTQHAIGQAGICHVYATEDSLAGELVLAWTKAQSCWRRVQLKTQHSVLMVFFGQQQATQLAADVCNVHHHQWSFNSYKASSSWVWHSAIPQVWKCSLWHVMVVTFLYSTALVKNASLFVCPY